ncbi:MAG: hypothetical protein HBSAPP04_06590 [Ignavibacteriaceae bacterium]|nr:MAG: hypothetical protein HBSAPP04_06590 [Ignavibacteriaceae bacterium]
MRHKVNEQCAVDQPRRERFVVAGTPTGSIKYLNYQSTDITPLQGDSPAGSVCSVQESPSAGSVGSVV